MATRLTLANTLARSIIQEILHQALLRNQARSSSRGVSEQSWDSSQSNSPTLISSTSSDSFFNENPPRRRISPGPDADMPADDRVFSSRASRRIPIFHSAESLYGYGSPPSPTKKLCSELQRVNYRRNAVVNQLQKTVTFPRIESIKWPQAKYFTPEIGRQKIIEFIEKTWNYSRLLQYFVEYQGHVGYTHSIRFRYCAHWKSPTNRIAQVFFNIDSPKNNSERIVAVTYTLGDGKIIHKPHTSNYIHRWLRELEKA